ncbi:MAG: rRNA pseudouridine synthase, partial [Eggerthellaceae bacterium]|nr:rRNA pseudouridine synthase [Eggerthellaceae bacterium]
VKGKRVILPEESVTIMLHKPAGYTTTMADPHAKHTVAELVPVDENPGLFPVGRLDTDTTGLLLFSTDGELGNALLHPKKHVVKTYIALVEGAMSDETAMRLSQGVKLSDGMTLPADVRIARGREARVCAALIGDGQGASGKTKRHEGKRSRAVLEKGGTYVIVGLREGRNRQVRRMMEAVGHPVIALHRESLGSLVLGDLPRGAWRELSPEEVALLQKESLEGQRVGRR